MKTLEKFNRPPRTIMEVHALLPEGTLCEIVENQLYMSPAPSRKHQRLSMIISGRLFNHAESNHLGEVYHAAIDVYLDEKNVFQPDIVFVSNKNKRLLSDRGIEGAPDLVIEILSRSNKKHDTEKKKPVYERCGVKEYWIIDPEEGTTYGYIRVKGKFQSIAKPSKIIRFKTLDLEIDLRKEL